MKCAIHYLLCIVTATALLAACAESQSPFGATGTMLQTGAHRLSGSYQQLYRFHPPRDGVHPDAGLLDVSGTLYGTTSRGGISQRGLIYSISTSGVEKVLYRFRFGSDGSDPRAGLIDVNGTLYGTTEFGGSSGAGTVYGVGISGGEKVLYDFRGGTDGANPEAALIDVNGTLYGTTSRGGNYNHGTVFSLTTSGTEAVLHSFAYGDTDGGGPLAELIDVNGTLYGTTVRGGNRNCGTVYSITPKGVEKVLYSFQCGSNGWGPVSGLIDVNGTLYGTTSAGGLRPSTCGGDGCGIVYGISTAGSEKALYRFKGRDGDYPQADLIDVNGVLYGTTTNGGKNGVGAVFSLSTKGVETLLYSFVGTTNDGFLPDAPLTDVNGTLYGTTQDGGDYNTRVYGYGTVFSLSP